MPSQAIRLIFPKNLIDEPIINSLIREYDFTINIFRANITTDEGWMDIQVTGKRSEIENATTWLQNQGIKILSLP